MVIINSVVLIKLDMTLIFEMPQTLKLGSVSHRVTINRKIDINRSSMANCVLRKLTINRNPCERGPVFRLILYYSSFCGAIIFKIDIVNLYNGIYSDRGFSRFSTKTLRRCPWVPMIMNMLIIKIYSFQFLHQRRAVSVYCAWRIHAHLRCTQCSILLHLKDI